VEVVGAEGGGVEVVGAEGEGVPAVGAEEGVAGEGVAAVGGAVGGEEATQETQVVLVGPANCPPW